MFGSAHVAKTHLGQCIYYVGMGSNDYAAYTMNPDRPSPDHYASLLIDNYSRQLRVSIRLIILMLVLLMLPSGAELAYHQKGQIPSRFISFNLFSYSSNSQNFIIIFCPKNNFLAPPLLSQSSRSCTDTGRERWRCSDWGQQGAFRPHTMCMGRYACRQPKRCRVYLTRS